MVRLVSRLRPSIVQTWLRQMDVLGGLAARFTRTPWVLTERSSGGAHTPGVKNALRAALAKGSDAIVSNSQGGDAYWSSRVDPRVRRWVIPNAVPVSEIVAAVPAADDEVRLPAGHRMVLAAGRLSPEKNLANLIRALRIVAPVVPVVGCLCGAGPSEPELRRVVVAEGLDRNVRLPGFVPSIWGWMKRAASFVSVSLFEGQPNAVLEATAAGCPLVLSEIPAHRELFDERSAVFVDPRSSESIAKGLMRCLGRPEESAARAERARRSISGRSVEETMRLYGGVYQSLVGEDCAAAGP